MHPLCLRLPAVLLAVLLLAAGALAPAPSPTAASGQAEQCFPETGFCVSGLFHDYWLANGGLARPGRPLTGEFEEINLTNGRT